MQYRFHAGLLTLLVLGVPMAAAGQQATVSPSPGRAIIMASGTGEVMLPPDRATVSVTVRTIASRADQASSRNLSTTEAVTAALRALGPDSLRSTGVWVGPNREYTPDGPKENGFEARRSVSVSTSDLSQVGRIIEAAVGAGATQIENVAYSSSKQDEARREALARAVDKARTDADAVATAAGGRVGSVILLSTEGANMPTPMYRVSALQVEGERSPLPEPEDLTVSATVQAQWVFEPAD